VPLEQRGIGLKQRHWDDEVKIMSTTVAALSVACLAACGFVQTHSLPSLVNYDDEWRRRQAVFGCGGNHTGHGAGASVHGRSSADRTLLAPRAYPSGPAFRPGQWQLV
jgi:hypothetical protein